MKILKETMEWVIVVVVSIVAAIFINNVVIVNAEVPTGSMENNIQINDRILALRFAYYLEEPKRDDIVVFKFPDNEEELFVKRIIGLPGETVTIKEGKVYINDSDTPLNEPFVKEAWSGFSDETYVVPEGHYFMMGDNRNNSQDSRHWINKFVSKDKILGKVVLRYFPNPRLYKEISQ